MKVSHIMIVMIILVLITGTFAGCISSGSMASNTSNQTGIVLTSTGSETDPSIVIGKNGERLYTITDPNALLDTLNFTFVKYNGTAKYWDRTVYQSWLYGWDGTCMMTERDSNGKEVTTHSENTATMCGLANPIVAKMAVNKKIADKMGITCSPLLEQVTVKAGTFETVRCTKTLDTEGGTKGGTITTILWIKPHYFLVKMQVRGSEEDVDMELVDYQVPQKEVVTSRGSVPYRAPLATLTVTPDPDDISGPWTRYKTTTSMNPMQYTEELVNYYHKTCRQRILLSESEYYKKTKGYDNYHSLPQGDSVLMERNEDNCDRQIPENVAVISDDTWKQRGYELAGVDTVRVGEKDYSAKKWQQSSSTATITVWVSNSVPYYVKRETTTKSGTYEMTGTEQLTGWG